MEGMHDTMLASDAPCPELGINHAYDRFTLADKVQPAKAFEDLRSFDNSAVVCCFTMRATGDAYSYPALRSLLTAATGLDIDVDEMIRIGERATTALRILSGRAGHTIEEDGLPSRFAQALPAGGSAGHPVDPDVMRQAIADYYEARGFDRWGPTDQTLRRLDMDDCVGRLQRG